MRVTVFGAGLVGSAIIKDLTLTQGLAVQMVDLDAATLAELAHKTGAQPRVMNLQQTDDLFEVLADSDLAICAVPGFMGFQTLKKIIETGTNVVDISFFNEDPFTLDELARAKGVTAVVDCGVAPGLSNVLAGFTNHQLDQMDSFTCYVGGLPQIRRKPFEYQAVFSPIDVIEEYTRPAKLVEHGQIVVRPALSELELVDLPGIGTLEAFNTDGLRTLAKTIDAPFMKEKTLRYPGHARLMETLRDIGLFNKNTITIDGQAVRPLDVTAELMFKAWRAYPDDADLTVMRVEVMGRKDNQPLQYTFDMLDKFDGATQTTAMARTTGYTCTIVAAQVLAGQISAKGILPPEYLGADEAAFNSLLAGYDARGIDLKVTVAS